MGQGEEFVTDQLVESVAELLACQTPKHEIKKFLYDYNGILHGVEEPIRVAPSTVEKALRLARDLLAIKAKQERGGMVAEVLEYYRFCIRDTSVPVREKLRAMEGLRTMMGLDARFGEQTSAEDKARRAIEILREMNASVDSPNSGVDERTEHDSPEGGS